MTKAARDDIGSATALTFIFVEVCNDAGILSFIP